MHKFIPASIIGVMLFAGLYVAQAQPPTIEDLQAQIQILLQQVQALQAQLDAARTEVSELKETLNLERSLERGKQGKDVETLQQVLATDPSVYPEGLVTGYFGPLTERAVKKFQSKFGIEQVGVVGPITKDHLNYILENGAGDSGVVPPGLLMRFKDQSIFESLPQQAKNRCKAVGRIPSGVVPFGIFAQCDNAISDNGTITEIEDENEIENEIEDENEVELE